MKSGISRLNRPSAVAALVVLLGLTAACGSNKTPEGSGSSSPGASGSASAQSLAGKTVALIDCPAVVPFCVNLNKIFVDTLEARGAKVTVATSNYDPAEQAQQLDQAVTQSPDAIFLMPFSQAALRPGLLKAKAAGIPVAFFTIPADKDLEGSGLYTTAIAADDLTQGADSADEMVAGIEAAGKTGGNVVVLGGTTGVKANDDRVSSFKTALEKHDGFKVIGEADTNYDPSKAAAAFTQVLAKGDKVDGIYLAAGGSMAQAVIQAATQRGLSVGGKDGIVIVSNGCNAASNKAMTDGQLFADSGQTPPSMALPAAEVAGKLLLGESVPDFVQTATPLFRSAELGKYKADCELG